MSGICAVWRRDHPEQSSEALSAVSEGLHLHPSERLARRMASGIGLGVAARFATQQVHENGQVMIACDADLTNEEELWSLAGRRESAGTAALLAGLYDRFGSDFVEKVTRRISRLRFGISGSESCLPQSMESGSNGWSTITTGNCCSLPRASTRLRDILGRSRDQSASDCECLELQCQSGSGDDFRQGSSAGAGEAATFFGRPSSTGNVLGHALWHRPSGRRKTAQP